MRGEEVKRLLSKDDSVADIPIIYLTGAITKEDEEIITRMASGHQALAKPVNKEELLQAVQQAFSL